MQRGEDPALLKELLANKEQHGLNAGETVSKMNELIAVLSKVRDVIDMTINDGELAEAVARIEALHRQLVDDPVRRFQVDFQLWLRQQLLGPGGGQDKK
jgi:hypothetical protein